MTEDTAVIVDERAEHEKVSSAAVLERVVMVGDLSKLSPVERVAYYARVCESLGLNPLTRPFDYLWLGRNDDKRLVLYARRDATDQIRRNLGVNIVGLDYPPVPDGLYGVTAHVTLGPRTDSATGIVSLIGYDAKPLRGDETKAKRRATLSIAGMGFIDESEVGSIPDGEPARVDDDGNVAEEPTSLSDVIAARVASLPLAVDDIPSDPPQTRGDTEADEVDEDVLADVPDSVDVPAPDLTPTVMDEATSSANPLPANDDEPPPLAPEPPPCGIVSPFSMDGSVTCKRERGHRGPHRAAFGTNESW